jgi:ribosomal subunit interface protein
MHVTYTGRQVELSPAQAQKLGLEFEKVGKLLDNGKGEAEARVILSHERHLNSVEVIVPYHRHELVGQAADPDLFTAIHSAVGKLEAQAIRVREKWRDGKRAPKSGASGQSEG